MGKPGNNSGDAQLPPAWPHGTLALPLPAPTLHGLKAGLQHLSWEPLGTLSLGSSGLVALMTSGPASLPHIPVALPDTPSQSYLPGRAGSCVPSPPGSPQAVGKQYQSWSGEGISHVPLSPRVTPAARARIWVLSHSQSSHCAPKAARTHPTFLLHNPSDLHQQGLYHGVHAPLGRHHGRLIATELLGAEGLGADGDVHLPCGCKWGTQSRQSPAVYTAAPRACVSPGTSCGAG